MVTPARPMDRTPASAPPRQLALQLLADAPPRLDNFVPGANAECLAMLAALADGTATTRLVYLWGLPGCGRSHLLRALAEARPGARRLGPDVPPAAFAFDPAVPLWAIDDCQDLDDERQQALFALVNGVRDQPQAVLVAAGDRPPRALALRDDVRSRLGWGLVFELAPLSDDDKARALARLAHERG